MIISWVDNPLWTTGLSWHSRIDTHYWMCTCNFLVPLYYHQKASLFGCCQGNDKGAWLHHGIEKAKWSDVMDIDYHKLISMALSTCLHFRFNFMLPSRASQESTIESPFRWNYHLSCDSRPPQITIPLAGLIYSQLLQISGCLLTDLESIENRERWLKRWPLSLFEATSLSLCLFSQMPSKLDVPGSSSAE